MEIAVKIGASEEMAFNRVMLDVYPSSSNEDEIPNDIHFLPPPFSIRIVPPGGGMER